METEGRWAEEDRKALRDILDRHDITIYTSKQDNELVSEIEFYSDLGEDFIMTFFWDGTAKGFTDGVQSYSEDLTSSSRTKASSSSGEDSTPSK